MWKFLVHLKSSFLGLFKDDILITIGQSIVLEPNHHWKHRYNQDLNSKISIDLRSILCVRKHSGNINASNTNRDLFQTCTDKPNLNNTNAQNSCLSSIVSGTVRVCVRHFCTIFQTNFLDMYLERTVDQVNENLNIGNRIDFHTEKISMTLEKVSLANISGKHLIQLNGAKIRFPRLNLNQTATINVIFNSFSFSLSLWKASFCIRS